MDTIRCVGGTQSSGSRAEVGVWPVLLVVVVVSPMFLARCYQFKSSAGTVKVNITTAGENYTLEIKAGKNPMAAQLACIELEKQLTFIALTG